MHGWRWKDLQSNAKICKKVRLLSIGGKCKRATVGPKFKSKSKSLTDQTLENLDQSGKDTFLKQIFEHRGLSVMVLGS